MNGPDEAGPRDAGRPDAGYQPASQADLDRFPPKDDACAAVRRMLRDHCDSELTAAERQQVDDHVHRCRDCALALSRMELEALRLRQAFADERSIAADVPTDFVGGVMGRIGRLVLEDESASPQFTHRVMERVRREWPQSRGWSFGGVEGRRRARRVATALGVLVVVVLFVIGSWSRGDRGAGVRFEIVSVLDASVRGPDGRTSPARRGQTLGSDDVLEADGIEEVVLERVDPRRVEPGGPIPAVRDARAVLDPGSVCRFPVAGELALVLGAVAVEASERFEIALPDGTRVGLYGGGSYGGRGQGGVEDRGGPGRPDRPGVAARPAGAAALVSVEPVRRHDDAVTGGRTLRTRIEVSRGRVRVTRGVGDPVVIAAGEVARFDSWSAIEIDVAPSLDLLARSARTGRLSPVASAGPDGEDRSGAASWIGRVVDAATGRGVERAAVEVRVGDRSLQSAQTDAEGWFTFTAARSDDSAAIVRVMPPRTDDASWATYGPAPLAMRTAQTGLRRLAPIALGPDAPLRGVVRGPSGAVVAGARVVPYVLDELFAVGERLDPLAVDTDEGGRFVLRGLPAEFDRHQSLAVVVEKAGLPRHAGVHLTAVAGQSVEVRLPEPRAIALAGLDPGELRVLREIPGIPLSVMSEEFRALVDAGGSARLDRVGPGALWAVDADGATLRALIEDRSSAVFTCAGPARPADAFDRLQTEPRRFLDGRDPVTLLADGRRLDRAVAAASPLTARYLAVHPHGGARVAGARLFLEDADGVLVFVGEVDASGSIPFEQPVSRPFRVVAIGADGSIGIASDEMLDAGLGGLDLVEPGSVEFSAAERSTLEPGALVVFECVGGPLDGSRFWRVCDAEHGFVASGLPVGTYRVGMPDGSSWGCEVRAGARVGLGDPVPGSAGTQGSGR